MLAKLQVPWVSIGVQALSFDCIPTMVEMFAEDLQGVTKSPEKYFFLYALDRTSGYPRIWIRRRSSCRIDEEEEVPGSPMCGTKI